MSAAPKKPAVLRLSPGFQSQSPQQKTCGQKRVFVSFRVSADEKAALEAGAAGESLSAYLRGRVFGTSRRAKASYSIADQQALARVLRALASSNLALDLASVCEAAESSDIPVKPLLADQLRQSCADVAAMRKDLIKASGLRPK